MEAWVPYCCGQVSPRSASRRAHFRPPSDFRFSRQQTFVRHEQQPRHEAGVVGALTRGQNLCGGSASAHERNAYEAETKQRQSGWFRNRARRIKNIG